MSLLTGKVSDFLKIGVAAAGRGDLATVRDVLSERPDWLMRVGSHGRTMLWEAAYRGRLPMVEMLLDRGADIHAWGCHFTPLLVDISPYCAARFKKHDAVADALQARGASADIYTFAYLGDGASVVECLRRDPNRATAERAQRDSSIRATPLHYAVGAGHLDIVASLLARGADPRPYAHWLVRFCIWRDRADILKVLLDAGLDPTTAELPRSGLTNPAIIALLARHGISCDPNCAEGGWPPIVFQSRGDRGGSVARIRDLIACGADVNARNHKGQTALHCAAKAGFVAIVSLLLDHGAEVDLKDREGQTPLMTASRSTIKNRDGLREVIRILASAGANPDSADRRGHSPRLIATRKRDADAWLNAMGLADD